MTTKQDIKALREIVALAMTDDFSNTEHESADLAESPKPKRRGGKPFVKGDPRINRRGRPKTFDQLREIALAIAREPAVNARGEAIVITDGYGQKRALTVVEAILRQWAASRNPRLQENFIRIAFGAIPQIPDVVAFQHVAVSWQNIASSLASAIARVVDDPVTVSLVATEIERVLLDSAKMHDDAKESDSPSSV